MPDIDIPSFAQPLLKFQVSRKGEAHAWLCAIQGAPFADLRRVIPLPSVPGTILAAQEQVAAACGPINPTGVCPETGRRLTLRVFRDLSAVILRDGPDLETACEVLPARLVLSSELWPPNLRDVPYHERGALRRVSMQGRPEGIRYATVNGEISADAMTEGFVREIEAIAAVILAAPAFADPRSHGRPPHGGRFLPFSIWPADTGPEALDDLRQAVLGRLNLDARIGPHPDEIYISRALPSEPWSTQGETREQRERISIVGDSNPALKRDLRAILAAAETLFPSAHLHGVGKLLVIRPCDLEAQSAHARIRAAAALRRLWRPARAAA